MSDQYVNQAQESMDAVERLLKGLPGVSGYIDKELRRDADKRLRSLIAGELEGQKQRLLDVQKRLLSSGGLRWLDDIDSAVQKLQILSDRFRTASYGYAGLFDPVRIREDELNALHRFDVAMAEDVGQIDSAITALEAVIGTGEDLAPTIDALVRTASDLNRLFDRRREAIVSPELLLNTEDDPISVEESVEPE